MEDQPKVEVFGHCQKETNQTAETCLFEVQIRQTIQIHIRSAYSRIVKDR